ncbi:MAG: gliding motility-associated ABC transporter substrate-binding protein GldG [Bacteroidota bacterium]|nr:gliding motility-associated ABC transporter substrate-binding protein GldG [Bacteroidota bacterium]
MNLFYKISPKLRFPLVLVAVIGIAYLLSLFRVRIDLTSEKRYSLSDYTKESLTNLKDVIYIKVYLEGDELPLNIKNLRTGVKEQLEEYKIYGKDKFEFEFIDPSESPKKEKRFAMYKKLAESGLFPIEAQEVSDKGKTSQKMVFPGLIMSCQGRQIGINLLSNTSGVAAESEVNVNNSIEELEYKLTNGIQNVLREKKQAIAFIEGHNEVPEINTVSISKALAEYYNVRRGALNGQIGILDNFKAVIVAKPMKKFSEKDKYVLDQYIMQGGNVLWLEEGTNTNLDSLFANSYTMALAQQTGLNDMLFNYGVRINQNLIMDKQSAPIGIRIEGTDGQARIEMFPWYYFPVISPNNNHPISKNLDFIRTQFVSSLDTVGADAEIQKTILLSTSNHSLTESIPARIELAQAKRMPPDEYLTAGSQDISVLLEGNFKSNFRMRSPSKIFPDETIPEPMYESNYSKMIVISDGDIIKNEMTQNGRPYPVGFDIFTKQRFEGNKEFITNAVNYLCEDYELMNLRSRELKLRLLNKDQIKNQRLIIQLLNMGIPVLIIILSGVLVVYFRKRKYT